MYRAFTHSDVPVVNNKIIWKLKVPLEINFYFILWYLRRGVIQTKDNLARRNWPGSKKCCFCHNDEKIKHLFFQWSLIQVTSYLYPPRSVANMFVSWLHGIDRKLVSPAASEDDMRRRLHEAGQRLGLVWGAILWKKILWDGA